MNRIYRRLRHSDAGVALIMVMGWMLVLATLVTAAIGYAIQTNVVAHKGQEWGSSLSAAQAGLEDFVARLNRNDNYGRTWDCTNNAMKGPNEAGNTCGWTATTPTGWIPVIATQPTGPSFHYDIDASSLDKNGTINVTSTGKVGKETRTVQAAIGRGGSTDFLYYTDLEDADPANTTVYPSPPTKYICGASGAQKDIYWWSPATTTTGGLTRSGGGCTEIGFAAADVLDGRVHFNDTPKLNAAGATFLASFETATPSCKTATAPNYSGCLRGGSPIPVYGSTTTPIPPIQVDPLYLDDTSAKFSTYPGCHYFGATRIKFNASPAGTMTVWSKDSAGKTTGTGCGTFTAGNSYTQTNLVVPTDQVIYVSAGSAVHRCLGGEIGDGLPLGTPAYTGSATTTYQYDQTMLTADQFCGQGNIYVEGTVQGRITLAAENSTVVTGDIVLANGVNGTDLVGLVAGNSVEVFHPYMDTWYKNTSNVWGWKGGSANVEMSGWPHRYTDPLTGGTNPTTGIQIDASIQTLQHSFWVQQYANGSPQGTLLVLGSIAQRWRGIVGQGSNGYIKLYKYDSRLKYSSPPYFPQWTNAKWGPRHTGELLAQYDTKGKYIG